LGKPISCAVPSAAGSMPTSIFLTISKAESGIERGGNFLQREHRRHPSSALSRSAAASAQDKGLQVKAVCCHPWPWDRRNCQSAKTHLQQPPKTDWIEVQCSAVSFPLSCLLIFTTSIVTPPSWPFGQTSCWHPQSLPERIAPTNNITSPSPRSILSRSG
jgi:hypothetical protein